MALMNKKIYIIIPAYNEQKNIRRVLDELKKYDYEVVVVDDGSEDNTYQIVHNKGAVVLRHKINRGQGAALQTGTEYALSKGAEVIVHFDADGQFLSYEIGRVVKPILSGDVDVVLGSRFIANSANKKANNADVQMPLFKFFFILPVARVINYFFTGLKLTDAHCGFRAMNKYAARKVKILQDGMSHNTEIVAQIKKYHLRFKEVPVSVIYKEFGQGVGGGVRILKELLLGKVLKN